MTALDGLTPLQLSACLPYFLQTTFLTKRRAFTGRSGTLDVSLPEHPEGQRVLAVAGLLRRYMSLLNQSLLSTTISCRARAPECLPTCCRPSTRMSPSTPRVTPLARPSSLPIAMLDARTSGGTRSGRPPENRSSSAGRVRPPGAVLDQPSFARMILSDVLTAQSHPCVSSCPYKISTHGPVVGTLLTTWPTVHGCVAHLSGLYQPPPRCPLPPYSKRRGRGASGKRAALLAHRRRRLWSPQHDQQADPATQAAWRKACQASAQANLAGRLQWRNGRTASGGQRDRHC